MKTYLIDYLNKSKTSKSLQPREKQAKREFQPFKGFYELWHLVKTGMRERTKYQGRSLKYHYNAWPCFANGKEYSLTSHQFNAYGKVDVEAAQDLLHALTAKGKDKPKNKANIIGKLAPICASF